jgi:phosphohistidine phosphatase
VDVYLLRHGKAEDAGPGQEDADRRLTRKGRDEITAAGTWMAARELRFDLIAASPFTRAQETAGIIAGCLGQTDRLVTWNLLAPGGTPESVCRRIGKHSESRSLLLVGHEPLLSALIGRIITVHGNAAVAMSKGSLAKIRGFSPATRPSGELHWLVTAAQMANKT